MELKEIVLNSIRFDGVSKETLSSLIEKPKIESMGDFSLACFSLSKILRKSPVQIADEIMATIENKGQFEKIENINGYLNFFFDKTKIFAIILDELKSIEDLKKKDNGKVVCVDYCSVNLAKYMHIGHFSTTIIGESVCRLFESQGWSVKRINYIGDYGTPFGKMVYGFKTWGNRADVEQRGVDAIQDYYVKFCKNENEELLDQARKISLEIENKTGEDYQIYQWFIEIARKECERIVARAGISFDDWRGEFFYNDKMEDVVSELKNNNLVKKSEGALVCDLDKFGLGVALIQRSDGASLYLTRDLAAIKDRYERYHFDEAVYVTAIQQNLHFSQLFKICELLGRPYAKNLFHASYGMFSLPEGKIASRKGKQALFEDILNLSEEKVFEILKSRDFDDETRQELAKKIGKSAIAFSVLKVDRLKDKVFDIEKATSFDGETGPYLQYSVARINSVIDKIESLKFESEGSEFIPTQTAFSLSKELLDFSKTVENAFDKKEPSLVSRKLVDICAIFNKLYGEEKFADPFSRKKTLVFRTLCQETKKILAFGMNLVCVDVIQKM